LDAKAEVAVFAGPTVGRRDVEEILGPGVRVLAPVALGDLYRECERRPFAIGIVDGYFDRVPSVWHKEILWAMTSGVHVFGAASMGALRAAELETYGMIGVGRIYEAFSAGMLEDDDEVAVAHADEESGYRCVSEALVNVRFTLAAAREEGIVEESAVDALLKAAKSLFYPERTFPRILALAEIPAATRRGLEAWLPHGRIDQKRRDALAMLGALRDLVASNPGSKKVRYHFERTDAWEKARDQFRQRGRGEQRGLSNERFLEELKVAGKFGQAVNGGLSRFLALEEARREGRGMEGDARHTALDAFRRERELLSQEDFDRWAVEQHLASDDAIVAFMREQGAIDWVRTVYASDAMTRVEDWLRGRGELGRWKTRATAKAEVLRRLALDEPEVSDSGLTRPQLIEWFFRRLGRDQPASLDLALTNLGFESEEELLRAVLREYLYCRHSAPAS